MFVCIVFLILLVFFFSRFVRSTRSLYHNIIYILLYPHHNHKKQKQKNSCNNISQNQTKNQNQKNTQPIDTFRLQTALCGECATFCDAAGQLFVETMKSEREGRTRLRDARRWRCKQKREVNKEADNIMR